MAHIGGVSDSGVGSAASIMKAAQIAAAALKTAVQAKIASNQNSLRKDYVRIAEDWRRHYSNIFVPLENIELMEAMNEYLGKVPKQEAEEEATRGRARAGISARLKDKVYQSVKCVGMYNTGAQQRAIEDASYRMGEAQVLGAILGDAKAFLHSMDRMSRNFANVMLALNRGRGMAGQHYSIGQVGAGMYSSMDSEYYMNFYNPPTERAHVPAPVRGPMRVVTGRPALELISQPETKPATMPKILG